MTSSFGCCYAGQLVNGPPQTDQPVSFFTIVGVSNNVRGLNRSPYWTGLPYAAFTAGERDTSQILFFDPDQDIASYNQMAVQSKAGNLFGLTPLGREQTEPRNEFRTLNSQEVFTALIHKTGWYLLGVMAADFWGKYQKVTANGLLPVVVVKDESVLPKLPIWVPNRVRWTTTIPVRFPHKAGPTPGFLSVRDAGGVEVYRLDIKDLRHLTNVELPAHLSGNYWLHWSVSGYPYTVTPLFVL